jgi:hypothetical protein
LETFIFILIILLLAGSFFFLKYRSLRETKAQLSAQKRSEYESRYIKSTPALAEIVSVESKFVFPSGGNILTHLVLNVLPPGGTNYVVSVDWIVEKIGYANLKPGGEVAIKIDPNDPKCVFPNVSWAKYYWFK